MSDDPKKETDGRDFFIVVYFKDFLKSVELESFQINKDGVLNLSHAKLINLKVVLTNCKITELKWPVSSY